MRILDLFCGTKSISNTFEDHGFEIITLDSDSQFNPDFSLNIEDWDYIDVYPKGYFDVIWASPPCEAFSVAAIGKNWRRDEFGHLHPKTSKAIHGINLVEVAIKIILYFQPQFWFIENPRGALRKLMRDAIPRNTITYCQYGETRMKPTDIWGIFPKEFPIRCCKNGDSCHERAPRGAKTGTQGIKGRIDRARIPNEFCCLLAEFIYAEIKENKCTQKNNMLYPGAQMEQIMRKPLYGIQDYLPKLFKM